MVVFSWAADQTRDKESTDLAAKGVETVKKQDVRARIEEIGIIPAVRTPSAEDARFAAEIVNHCRNHRDGARSNGSNRRSNA